MDLNTLVAIVIWIGFILFLFYQSNKEKEYLCKHEWEIMDAVKVFNDSYSKRPCEIKYILRCKKCGDIKEKEIKG